MALRTNIEKLSICVRISGKPLEEHKVPRVWRESVASTLQKEVPRVQKCIESQPGRNFDLELRLEPGFKFTSHFNVLKCTIRIDGKRVMNLLLMRKHYYKNMIQPMIRIVPGMRELDDGGNWHLRRFKFTDLNRDDGTIESDISPEDIKPIGTIQVSVYPCKSIAVSPTKDSTGIPLEQWKLSEEHLKGHSADTATVLDGPESLQSTTECWKTQQVSRTPLASYTFWYCTKTTLQKLGIIVEPSVPAEEVNDLEMQRLSNIRERNALLQNLGLDKPSTELAGRRKARATTSLLDRPRSSLNKKELLSLIE